MDIYGFMNFLKFISDIGKINYATPELAAYVRAILYAAVRDEMRKMYQSLERKIAVLEQIKKQDQSIRNQIAQYKQALIKLSEHVLKIDRLYPNRSEFIERNELPPQFIADFAKAFRNIRHLQRVLANGPGILRKYEGAIILSLLENLNEQELQIQLEAMPDRGLTEQIDRLIATYNEAKRYGDYELAQKAERVVHLSTMILIKKYCLKAQAEASENPVNTYKGLLQTLTNLIPNVGRSTIFDNISSSQIALDPRNSSTQKLTINQLLYSTRSHLRLDDLPWYDSRQLDLSLPSRNLYQHLRFGQEDRRIYDEIRRKNLTNDLFMLRNIFDMQQITQEAVQQDANNSIARLEKRIYETAITDRITSHYRETILPQMRIYSEYLKGVGPENDRGYRKSEEYLRAISEYNKSSSPSASVSAKKTHVERIASRLDLYNRTAADLLKHNKHTKVALLKNAYVIKKLETIFGIENEGTTASESKKIQKAKAIASANIPCPEPDIYVDDKGLIHVTLSCFRQLTAYDVTKDIYYGPNAKYSPNLHAETKVAAFIQSHGDAGIETETFSGKTLEEVLSNIENSGKFNFNYTPKGEDGTELRKTTGLAIVTQKFKQKAETLKLGIRLPKKNVSDLGIREPQNEIKIRSLLLLSEFLSHYKGAKLAVPQAQEDMWKPLRTELIIGEYEKAAANIGCEIAINSLFTWIATLNRSELPVACLNIYDIAEKISSSSKERIERKARLTAALNPENYRDAHTQQASIADIFTNEYLSEMGQTILNTGDHERKIREDIASMAQEYTTFSRHTMEGDFSVDPETQHAYLEVLKQIAQYLQRNGSSLGDLNKVSFKLSYATLVGWSEIIVTGEDQRTTLKVPINLAKPLPYSLTKSHDNPNFLLSYGGSRGIIAPLQGVDKKRYFTNFRIYGVGQYGTVIREDDFISGEGLVLKKGFIEPNPAPHCYSIVKDFDINSPFEEDQARKISLETLKKFFTELAKGASDQTTIIAKIQSTEAFIEKIDRDTYTPDIQGKEIDKFLGQNIQWIAQLDQSVLSPATTRVYNKALEIAPLLSTYPEELRQNPLYCDITSRDDPNSVTERTILEAISVAKQEADPSLAAANHSEYSVFTGKQKHIYTQGIKPLRYKLFQALAKGKTYKDMTDEILNQYVKGSEEYHRPIGDTPKDLQNALSLSTAIVDKVAEYRLMGFRHNDIKPENFMALRRSDGTYSVEFIDWATGGFRRVHQATQAEMADPQQMFVNLHGCFPQYSKNEHGELILSADNGCFLTIRGAEVHYGINPSLEILHGRRNCTLPYIAPKLVLGEGFVRDSMPADWIDPSLTTRLHGYPTSTNDPLADAMDDWALTALAFGICNRKAYFKLATGRAVNDYTVPDVISTDGTQLYISNIDKFNQFFSPSDADDMSEMEDMDNPHAVMYIPSTKREGQPLHLFRRLQDVLQTDIDSNLKTRITGILRTIRTAVANGTGLPLAELQVQLKTAHECLQEIEKQESSQRAKLRKEILNAVIREVSSASSPSQFLNAATSDNKQKNIEILCAYPSDQDSLRRVLPLFENLDSTWLRQNILGSSAPLKDLLSLAITHHQPAILSILLNKLKGEPALKKMISDQGLLLYALQQGMTESARVLIAVSEANPTEILDLLINKTYGPSEGNHYITWHTNALHAAVRNNNMEQIQLILGYLPQGTGSAPSQIIRTAILEGLYFSADLLNVSAYNELLNQYNQKNNKHKITTDDILNFRDPILQNGPYHLFLTDVSASMTAVNWPALTKIAESQQSRNSLKNFLMQPPYPCVIAAENKNIEGLIKLLELARTSELLSAEESADLLLQKDGDGANLLNHVLENGNVELIAPFFTELDQQPGMDKQGEIFYKLLGNSAPNNPLINFLTASNAPSQFKYDFLTLCLQRLTADPNDDTQQRRARNILVDNSAWLIQESTNPTSQTMLEQLLGLESLTTETKLSVFQSLADKAKEQHNQDAYNYYTAKFAAYSRSAQGTVATAPLDFQATDLLEIHMHQYGDIQTILADLLKKSEETYEARHRTGESQRDQLKTEIEGLKRKIKDLEEKQSEWQRNRDELTTQIASLESEKQKAKDEKDEIVIQIRELTKKKEAEIAALKQEYSGKETDFEAAKDEIGRKFVSALKVLEQRLDEMQEHVNKAHSEIVRLSEEIKTKDVLARGTQAQLLITEDQVEQLKKTLVLKEAENTELLQKVSELGKETDRLILELSTTKQEAKDWSKKLQAKEIELEELRLQQSQTGEENTEAQDRLIREIEELKVQLKLQLSTMQNLESRLKDSALQLQILELKNSNLFEENSTLNHTVEQLREQIRVSETAAQREALELQTKIFSLEEMVRRLEQSVADFTRKLEKEQARTKELTAELEEINKSLLEKSSLSESTISDLQAQRRHLEKELENRQETVLALQSQIESLTRENTLLLARQESEFTGALNDLKEKLKTKSHEAAQLSTSLQLEIEKSEFLSQRVSVLQEEVSSLRLNLSDASQLASELQSRLEEKENALLELLRKQEKSGELNTEEQTRLKNEIEELKVQLKSQLSTMQNLEARLKDSALQLQILELKNSNLFEENSTLNHTVEQLREQIRVSETAAQREALELQTKIFSLEEIVRTLEQSVADFTRKLEKEQARTKELTAELEEINKSLLEKSSLSESTISELQSQRRHLEKELENRQETVLALQSQIDSLTRENTLLLARQESEFTGALNDLKEKLSTKSHEAAQLSRSLQLEIEKSELLSQRVSVLQEEVSSLRLNLSVSSQLASELQSRLEEKENALLELLRKQEKSGELNTEEQTRLKNEIEELKVQLKSQLSTMQNLEARLKDSALQLQILELKNSNLFEENSTLNHTVEQLREQIRVSETAAQREALELQTKIFSLEEIVRTLEQSVADFTRKLEKEQARTKELTAELEEINKSLLEKSSLSESTISELQSQRRHLEKELENRQETVLALQSQIDSLTRENTLLLARQESEFTGALNDLKEKLSTKSHEAAQLSRSLQLEIEKSELLSQRVSVLQEEVSSLRLNLSVSSQLASELQSSLEEKENALLELLRKQEKSRELNTEEQTRLKNEIEELKVQLKSQLSTMQNLEARLKDSALQLQILELKNSNLFEENSTLNHTVEQLREQIRVSETAAQREALELQTKIFSLEEIVRTLEQSVADFTRKLEKEQARTKELTAELEEINKSLLEKSSLSESTISELQSQRRHLEKELENRQETVLALQSQIDSLTRENTLLLARQESEFTGALNDLKEKLSTKSHEAAQLSRSLQLEIEKSELLSQRVSVLQEEVSSLRLNLSVSSQLASELQSSLEEKENALLELLRKQEKSGELNTEEQTRLKNEIEELKVQLKSQLSTMQNLEARLKDSALQLQILELKNSNLFEENSTLNHTVEQLREQIRVSETAAQREALELQTKIFSLEEIVIDLREAIDQTGLTLNKEREKIRVLTARIKEIEAEMLEKTHLSAREISQLQNKHRELELESDSRHEIIFSLQQNLRSLTEQNQLLLEQKSGFTDELQHLETQLDQKTSEAYQLAEELNAEKDLNRKLNRTLSEAQAEVGMLRFEVKGLTKDKDGLHERLSQAALETKKLHTELLELQTALNFNLEERRKIEKELLVSNTDNALLRTELARLRDHYQNLSERQRDLFEKYTESQRENARLRQDIEKSLQKIDQMHLDNDYLLRANQDLEIVLSRARQDMQELMSECLRLEEIIHEKDFRIDELESLLLERQRYIARLEQECGRLNMAFNEHLSHGASYEDLQRLRLENESIVRALTQADKHIALLQEENAALRAAHSHPAGGGYSAGGKRVSSFTRPSSRRPILDETGYDSEEIEEEKIGKRRSDRRKTDTRIEGEATSEDADFTVTRLDALEETFRDSTIKSPSHRRIDRTVSSEEEDAEFTIKKPVLGLEESGRMDETSSEDFSDSTRRKKRPSTTFFNHPNRERNLPRGGHRGRIDDDYSDGGRDYYRDRSDHRVRGDDDYGDGGRDGYRDRGGRRGRDHYREGDRRRFRDRYYDSFSDDDDMRGPGRRRRSRDSTTSPLLSPVASPTASRAAARTLRGDMPAMTATTPHRAEAKLHDEVRTLEDVHADIEKQLGATHPDYKNDIMGVRTATADNRYVRVSSINPAAPTDTPKKLMDATLDKVTVFRRFTESSLSATDKARLILSSMGIPPNKDKGFELPDELVINGKNTAADFARGGANDKVVEVIHEMFRLYDEQKTLELGAGGPPVI